MTAQKGLIDMHRELVLTTRWKQARAGSLRSARGVASRLPRVAAVMLCCALPAAGCKTGTALSKPSWWTFGGGKDNAGTLASAPPYEGDIKKPSESAVPYPTTSTPSGYVITGSSGGPALAAQPQASQPTGPVVYGSTPPAAAGPVAANAASPSAMTAAAAGGVAAGAQPLSPQVGPYSALAGDTIPPPGQPLPPIGPTTSAVPPASVPVENPLPGAGGSSFPAVQAATSPPAQAGGFDPVPARMADSRFAAPAMPATPPAATSAGPAAFAPPASTALPAEPVGQAAGRYATGSGSRFAGAAEAGLPLSAGGATVASPASYGRPDEALPPPSGTPYTGYPGQAAPAAAPPAQPATPGLLQPSGPPVRRPDSGWRPGGTSSYRPSGAILADDAPPATGGVRTAAFEEPAAIRQ